MDFPWISLQPTRALVESSSVARPRGAHSGRGGPRRRSGASRPSGWMPARCGSTRFPACQPLKTRASFRLSEARPAAGRNPSGGHDARHCAQCSRDGLSRQVRRRVGRRRYRRGGRHVRRRQLLARSRRLHLEHQDHGRARSGPRHADPLPQAGEAARLARRRGRDRDRGRRRARILDFVRDRDRARLWPHPHQGRRHLDPPDHDGRTQGPRREGGLHPARSARGTASIPAPRPGRNCATRRPRSSATKRSPMC